MDGADIAWDQQHKEVFVDMGVRVLEVKVLHCVSSYVRRNEVVFKGHSSMVELNCMCDTYMGKCNNRCQYVVPCSLHSLTV